MHRGYIKLWRKMQDDDLWNAEKFTRGQAWVDLIMLANHKPQTIIIRGIATKIRRGQLAYSELSLSTRWKWSRGKTRRFLQLLESQNEQKIVQQKNNVTSLITIKNYERYQEIEQQAVHQTDTKQDNKRYTNNNDKNDKNVKNKEKIQKKKVYLPKNFQFTQPLKNYAMAHNIDPIKLNSFFEHFCDKARAKGYQYKDWDAAFRNFVRQAPEYSKQFLKTKQEPKLYLTDEEKLDRYRRQKGIKND